MLPKLKDPPLVRDNVCGNMTVTFLKWVKDLDIGDGPIGEYRYMCTQDKPSLICKGCTYIAI